MLEVIKVEFLTVGKAYYPSWPTPGLKLHQKRDQSSGAVLVETDIFGSPTLIVRTVSVDVKYHKEQSPGAV